MELNRNMVRWTDLERALLAHFVRVAETENGLSASEGCDFAAKKLGRSAQAYRYQYYSVVKAKGLNNNNLVVEEPDTEEQEYFTTVEELLNTIKELKFIDQAVLEDYYFQIWRILGSTGNITLEDITYQNNLLLRKIAYE